MKSITAHFRSDVDKRVALAEFNPKDYPRNPEELSALVKAGKIPERYVKFVPVKLGGMSRASKPKDTAPKKPLAFKLGAPFLTSTDGPSILAQIAQAFPAGFRSPSKKAKNWRSTSLVEQVMKIKPKFERSTRGEHKQTKEEEYRAAVVASQNIHTIADKYLNRGSRERKRQILADLRAAGYPERAAA